VSLRIDVHDSHQQQSCLECGATIGSVAGGDDVDIEHVETCPAPHQECIEIPPR